MRERLHTTGSHRPSEKPTNRDVAPSRKITGRDFRARERYFGTYEKHEVHTRGARLTTFTGDLDEVRDEILEKQANLSRVETPKDESGN